MRITCSRSIWPLCQISCFAFSFVGCRTWIFIYIFQAGFAPLHLSVLQMSLDMVEFLLRLEVDSNVRDHQGRTPLHLVIEGPFNGGTGSNMCEYINFLSSQVKSKQNFASLKTLQRPLFREELSGERRKRKPRLKEGWLTAATFWNAKSIFELLPRPGYFTSLSARL